MMHSLLPVTDCSNDLQLVERRNDAVNHNNYVSSSVSSSPGRPNAVINSSKETRRNQVSKRQL